MRVYAENVSLNDLNVALKALREDQRASRTKSVLCRSFQTASTPVLFWR